MERKYCLVAATLVWHVLFAVAVRGEPVLWRPFYQLDAQGSSLRWAGGGNVVIPLWQDRESLLMSNFRVLATDHGATDGNFGLVHRSILDCDRILGVYGFYDLQESRVDNVFHQASVGAELLDVHWGLRVNGYIPQHSPKSAPGTITFSQGEDNFVQRGLEAAYWGIDCEAEGLLWYRRDADFHLQVWAAAGMFHFDNGSAGFHAITGPRVRTELRIFDLPTLGLDSRLVLSGQYDYDGMRGGVGTGLVSVRIPIGRHSRKAGTRLTGLNRRMVAPIVRNVGIVTQTGLGDRELNLDGLMNPGPPPFIFPFANQ